MTDTLPTQNADPGRRSSLTQYERREMNQLLTLSFILTVVSGLLLLGAPALRGSWLIWSMLIIGLAAGLFAFWVKWRF